MQTHPDAHDAQVPRPPHLHPQTPDYLSRLYEAWLESPVPGDPDGRRVAGSKVTRGIMQGRGWSQDDRAGWDALRACWDSTPERVWIWSDLHLFHANILRYTGRPFESVGRMGLHLLEQAQALVAPQDWLLCLGDLSFGSHDVTREWLRHCPGHKALMLGNHDVDRKARDRDMRQMGFEAIADSLDWPLALPLNTRDGTSVRRLWFTHYPLWKGWIPDGTLNVHGHIHDKLLSGPRLNVSVEQVGYAPVRLIDQVRGHHALTPAEAEDRWDDAPTADL